MVIGGFAAKLLAARRANLAHVDSALLSQGCGSAADSLE
jgi:hypothetical protein